jgi:hypothetical protein
VYWDIAEAEWDGLGGSNATGDALLHAALEVQSE